MIGRKTVFLDRDGTINVEKNYLYRPEEFKFIPKAPDAIKMLNQAGYQVIVVSNQAGVARGYYTEEDVGKLHHYVNELLKNYNAHIDAFYYCPHHPEAGVGKYKVKCHCRKPETGLFEKACADFPVDIENSWMIGDNVGDIEAGNRFNLRTILVRTGYGSKLEKEGFDRYQYMADDLYDAVKNIVCKDSARKEIRGMSNHE